MLISTGSGILDGSPMVPTSFAIHSPLASCLTSQSFEVSAAAVIAQLTLGLSDHRISSGAPGTANTLVGLSALKAQSTMAFPNVFIASPHLTGSPSGPM